MTITLNGTTGITSPEVVLDNTSADGGQTVLKSSGFSDWNLDNYNGRLRAYNGSTERMTIDTSGNVGIGTTSPSSYGQFACYKASGSNFAAIVSGSNQIYIGYDSVYAGGGASAIEATGALAFGTGASLTERMRINSSGNLLIGSTTGASDERLYVETTNADWCIQTNNTGSGTFYHIGFRVNGNQVGRIQGDSSSTQYLTSSDYRLKENIAPMTGALAKVTQLRPVTYTWKATGEASQGFIAHELQAIVPECVAGEKDAVDENGNPEYQGIDTSFLVATLTAAIQELKAELDTVKAEVTALKGTA